MDEKKACRLVHGGPRQHRLDFQIVPLRQCHFQSIVDDARKVHSCNWNSASIAEKSEAREHY
jgi:hypothetical protein